MRLPFTQVDAFADRAFAGNPAAVIPLAEWLDDALLQAIAAENNLSETAFLVPLADDPDADFALRWFTPTDEVALCGHATLASGHVVLSSDGAIDEVRFRTRQAGLLRVARVDDGYALDLPAWAPAPRAIDAIVAALGVTGVVETLWHDKGYALVVVDDPATVRDARPDQRALAAAERCVAIVAARDSDTGTDADIVSRVFTPAYGIDEDPVTGSAHAVMVPYFAAVLGRDAMTAWQASARGGRLTCRLAGDRVVLGGRCVTTIEGSFLLP